jgi:hypothetical protein
LPAVDVVGYDYDGADQPVLVEVWIEKTTVNDVLAPVCGLFYANLVSGPGFQSITSVVRLLERCQQHGKPGRVVYVADFDPAGRQMPVAVARQLEYYREKLFPDVDVSVEFAALTLEQIVEHELPRIPIKDTDHRRAGFEERYGEGAVELDALEALVPGELARIVQRSIVSQSDFDLRSKLHEAGGAACQTAHEEWVEETAEIRRELEEIKGEIEAIVAPYREPIKRMARELNEALVGYQERIDDLRDALDDARDEFDPELPERPEATMPPTDEGVLFDSRRDWREQLDHYRREGE